MSNGSRRLSGPPPTPTRASRRRTRRRLRRPAVDTTPRPAAAEQPVARRPRRRLPDQLHVGHHRAAEMRCAHPESVALLPPEGRRQRRAHRRRRVPSGHPHAVRLRDLDLAHHADPPGRDDRPDRTVRPCRDMRGDRAPPGDGAVLRQHAVGDDPGRPRIAGPTTSAACGSCSPAASRCPTRRRPGSRS